MENLFFSAIDIAEILGISRSNVYFLRQTGKISNGVKIGGSRRWSLKELEKIKKLKEASK